MRTILAGALLLASCFCVAAQEPAAGSTERRVALTETAVALDGSGASALEATLRTTALHGAEDSPVTNIRLVVKNSSSVSYAFVSGLVTFYDSEGVRCGEGLFKADALSVGEAFETDTPGIRIRCAPATWRIIANSLLLRVTPSAPIGAGITASRSGLNLVISVDGEEHPIQLDKPMVLTLGDKQRTIVLREAP
ncbi:MAG TPA: hypothetical protein VGJ48_10990 [Pyrinomonadaceae bacterium]